LADIEVHEDEMDLMRLLILHNLMKLCSDDHESSCRYYIESGNLRDTLQISLLFAEGNDPIDLSQKNNATENNIHITTNVNSNINDNISILP
jgi:hypothetical protein